MGAREATREQDGAQPERAALDAPAPSRARVKPSRTAEINASERAWEMAFKPSRRLFEDPFAHHFARSPAHRAMRLISYSKRNSARVFDWLYPGAHAQIILRYRLYEQELRAALDEGVEQVVLLGAGYDSTSLRLDLGGAVLYELDTPHTQRSKLEVLERKRLVPRNRVVYVPCDFEVQKASERLAESGFDASRPAFVLWYGVMYYLSAEAVRQTLADIATLSAPGSRLVLDYLDASVVDGTTTCKGARRAARGVARRGEPYTFGLTPETAAALLEEFGFEVRENLRVRDLAERFAPPSGVWCSTDDWFGTLSAARRAPA